jgi:hypothetical protein
MPHQFRVSVQGVQFPPEVVARINTAIQRAVLVELAGVDLGVCFRVCPQGGSNGGGGGEDPANEGGSSSGNSNTYSGMTVTVDGGPES